MLALSACANPNGIGVQDTGTVIGRVYDTGSSQGLPNVLVSVGSLLAVNTAPDGSFSLPNVPVGLQTVTVTLPPGYSGATTEQVDVLKNQTVAASPAFGLTPLR
ncbi:MAG TPA: carboxypeptidase-like regulatory domain-containing protein [Candidatus Baltobacteraceae bacterium]